MATQKIDIEVGVKGASLSQQQLEQLAKTAEAMGARLKVSAREGSAGLKAVDEAARQAKGAAEDMAAQAGPLGAVLSKLGPAGFAAAAGIGAIGLVLSKAVTEAAEAERAMVKIEAVVKATGGASGKSAREIDELTKALARTTMATEADLKNAATQLLTFGGIAGKTFDDTLKAAQDLAAGGFGSLEGNVVALGRALQDPVNGVNALRKVFPALTEAQADSIKVIADQNGLFEAQGALIDAVASKVGGAGAAEGNTLTGAWKRFGQEFINLFEEAGGGLLAPLRSFLDYTAEVMHQLSSITDAEKILAGLEAQKGWLGRRGDKDFQKDLDARIAAAKVWVAVLKEAEAVQQQLAIDSANAQDQHNKHVALMASATKSIAKSKEMVAEADRAAIAEHDADIAASLELEQFRRKQLYDWTVAKTKETEDLKTGLEKAASQTRIDEVMTAEADAWFAQQEQIATQMKTIWDEAARDMFDAWRDAWRDLLSGKINDFDDFAKRILSIGLDLAANLAAAQTWEALAGGGGGFNPFAMSGANGKAMSSLDTFAANKLGISGASSYLAGAGAGYAGYSMSSALFKSREGPGNEIGGAVGGAAGMYLGGPLGAFVGSFIGSTLGGLFGAHATDGTEENRVNLLTGAIDARNLGADKRSPENRSAVDGLTSAVLDLQNLLNAAGLTSSGVRFSAAAGSRDGNFRVSFDGGTTQGMQTFSTAQEAFKFLAQQLIGSLTDVPATIQTLIDNVDYDNLEQFTQDLQGIAAATVTIAGVRDMLAQIDDPKAWELGQLDKQFEPLREAARRAGEGLTDVERLYGIKRKEILDKYLLDPIVDLAAPDSPLVAMGNWMQIVGAHYDKRIAQLQDEAQALEQSSQAWASAAKTLRGVGQAFLLDANLSPLSLEGRRKEAFSQLEAASARLQGGDLSAAGELPALQRAALEASRAYYRSSEEYYKDFERVQAINAVAAEYAAQQVTIDQMQLSVLQEILMTLQAGRDAAANGMGPGSPGNPGYNIADAQAFVSSFNDARSRSGLSELDFLNSAEGAPWLAARNDLVSGISDPDLLRTGLAGARDQKGRAGWEAIGAGSEAAFLARFEALGLPSYDKGGWVDKTSLAMVHQGEYVAKPNEMGALGAKLDRVAEMLQGQSRLIAEAASREINALSTIAESNTRMADAEENRRAAAGYSGRSKVLKG